jgi:hypothetical protein
MNGTLLASNSLEDLHQRLDQRTLKVRRTGGNRCHFVEHGELSCSLGYTHFQIAHQPPQIGDHSVEGLGEQADLVTVTNGHLDCEVTGVDPPDPCQ